MSLPWRIVTGPRFIDQDGDGVYEKRIVHRGAQGGGPETLEVALGDTSPEILDWQPGTVETEGLRGSSRVFRLRPDRVRLRVPLDYITGASVQTLYRILSLGRPVAFTPWWGPETIWASGFSGIEEGGMLAEIGHNSPSMLTPRSDGDYHAPEGDGWLRLATGAKLVPGLIGRALLLERDTLNVMPSDTYTPAAGVSSRFELTGEPNGGPTSMVSCYIPDTDYIDLVSGGLTLAATTNYVASIWAKGEGSARLVATNSLVAVTNGATVTLDPGRWTRIHVAFLTVGTGEGLSLEADGSEVRCTYGAVMVEKEVGTQNRNRPSSYQAVGATVTGDSDKLFINAPVWTGGGFTLALWMLRDNPSDRGQIFSARDNSVNYYAYLSASGGHQMFYNLMGGASNDRTATLPAPSGTWEQFVFVVRKGVSSAGMEQALYHNGLLIDTDHSPAGSENLPDFSDGWYIGGAFSPISTGDFGLNFPLDCLRMDARAWTQADVTADYAMRREAAITAMLTMTQGRLFRIASAPKRFMAGIFTDRMEGDLILEQVSHITPGVL